VSHTCRWQINTLLRHRWHAQAVLSGACSTAWDRAWGCCELVERPEPILCMLLPFLPCAAGCGLCCRVCWSRCPWLML